MMFVEAKAMIDKPNFVGDGQEYNDTSVGHALNLIHTLHGPGDSYNVIYREIRANGHVALMEGIANYDWILKRSFHPGVELLSVKPSKETIQRWTSLGMLK